VIDCYLNILSNTLSDSHKASEEQKQQQLDYHTLYFFQVLTLDRGTSSGLLIHNENDLGILASLPSHVNVDLLKTWIKKCEAPQDSLLTSLIAVLPNSSIAAIENQQKESLAECVRQHYNQHPEALALQAASTYTPPTVSNHQ